MKTVFSNKCRLPLIGGTITLFVLSGVVIGLLISSAPSAFALTGSNATLNLTVPKVSGCDPKVKGASCLLDTLSFHYRVVNSKPGIQGAIVGIFENDCNGSSIMAETTNLIVDGKDTRTFQQSVYLQSQKLPTNWVFCLFLLQKDKLQLFGQGKFTNVQSDGRSVTADIKAVS